MSKVEEAQGDGKKKSSAKDAAFETAQIDRNWPSYGLVAHPCVRGKLWRRYRLREPEYISPNAIRHMVRKQKGDKYADRVNQQESFRTKKDRLKPQEDALSRKRVFA